MTRFRGAGLGLLLLIPALGTAQQPDSVPGLPRMRLRADTLRLQVPAAFYGAGRLAWPRLPPSVIADRWADTARAHLAAADAARRLAWATGDTLVYQRIIAATRTEATAALVAPDEQAPRRVQFLGQYADLGIELNALLETRFERRRNLHCTALDAQSFDNGCRGGFTPPRLDPQFSVRTGGVVGQRVHVNVDYDTQREFDASNNIQVSYEGLEDEILRRIDVGNVSFAAPNSRFITGGIPANNFGLAARAQVGALELGGLFAQQKGNVAKARVFSVGGQTVIPVDRAMADRDFEPQRFFFVRDPRALPRYPAIDVLDIGAVGIPDSVRVTQVRIYRHRSTITSGTTETNLTGLQAVALRGDSPQRAGPIAWELLVEGRDYYLDPSGLWFGLAARLDQQDFLAVSYVTARGDTVGTFPAAATAGRIDTLELIYTPQSSPDVPTFFYEMRNAYRVGAVDGISRSSVALSLLVGGSAKPQSGAATFLALLGISLSTDATTFDEYNRLFPRQRDPGSGTPLRDYFVILPHLTPFADSTRLAPEFRTDSLYRTPYYKLRTEGPPPLWQLSLHYDARGGDTRGNLLLGGYQIRAGSERVLAAGRLLTRNVDYTINYEVGQLTFLHPDSLFPRATQVSVQFEENQAFAVAPTSIYGLSMRYDLGDHGSLSAVGLYQTQRSTFTRPPLGFEAASNLVAGVTGNFRFEPMRLSRLLDALPLIHTEAPSLVTLDAEIATSRPSPNHVGTAYVETFESEAGFFLPLGENQWEYGSRPGSPSGTDVLGINPVTGFDDADAVLMTWQNLIPAGQTGNATFQLRSVDIDPAIVLQGAGLSYETVLWMALHPDSIGGLTDPATFAERWKLPHTPGPRWRSITQPLSATGVDLSRIEYLEFWVLEDNDRKAKNAGASIVFDFGSLYEDAVDFQPTQFTTSGADTSFTGRRRAGEGRLDTERDTLTATFNAQVNDNGILGDVADTILDATAGAIRTDVPLCTSLLRNQLVTYSWGSAQTHCTRRNGGVDTEDLNNDQHLDTLIAATGENIFRYRFKFGDPRYLVRDGKSVTGVGQWHLYRIPFRADTLQVGAPDIRQIRAVRMTVIAPQIAAPESTLFFALARMRLVGAPWLKRAGTPIAGLGGQRGEPHGEVIASVITTENKADLGYEPPPGVTNEGATLGTPGVGATQINERSLRLVGTDMRPGERAEAYFRFPEGDRNFLGYRELRVWARGRGAAWDRDELTFFVKVGQDENNFYLFRQHQRTASWLPEAVVDLRQWNALRATIEQRFLAGQAPSGAALCGGDTLAYVACSGPYLVQVRNPSIAPPNLTRVQELAVGFIRDSGSALDSTELWVDDIRLSDVVRDAGYAGAVNVGIAAGDVMDLTLFASRRDGSFRQLGENPTYNGTNQLSLASTARLDRFGLDRLGLTAPLTIRYDRSSDEPYFLTGTDVLASGLSGLRQPGVRNVSWSIAVRRSRRGTHWWQRAFTDNLGFSALSSTGNAKSALSTSRSRVSSMRTDYAVSPANHGIRYVPGFLRSALDKLPGFLRRSDMVRGLRDGRLRLTPTALTFSSDLVRSRAEQQSFRVPIATPFDTVTPVAVLTSVLRTSAGLDIRPFSSMSAGVSASWDRDLKDYGDSTTVGVIASASRDRLLGLDLGFVRQRTLNARFAWQPPVASWVRPSLTWNSNFTLSRDPNATIVERTEGDSAGGFRLPTTFGNGASLDLNAALDLSRMLRGVFGDSARILRILDRISQFDMGRRIDRRSQFDRAGFDPGTSYLLGFGGTGKFLAQEGRLAIAASDQRSDRAALAMRLPLGLSLTSAYARRLGQTWYLRGTTQQLQRSLETDWPNVSARWLWAPRGGLVRKVITSINATVGYSGRSQLSETPSLGGGLASGPRYTQDTRSVPVNLSVSWAPRITTTLSIGNEKSTADRTGNRTLGDRRNTAATAVFSFRPPRSVVKLPSDIRTSLRYSASLSAACVVLATTPDCISIADSRQTEYNLTMDTDLPPSVVAGFNVGYVLTDDRHLNRKFSLFTLTASARIFFRAGEIR